VASFIGNPRMNFLPCVLHHDVPALGGRDAAWQLPITEQLRDTIRANIQGEAVLLGIRPEDMMLTAEPVPERSKPRCMSLSRWATVPFFDMRIDAISSRFAHPLRSTQHLALACGSMSIRAASSFRSGNRTSDPA
jgi:ABC-type sugar transport system ATPase subunit